jgi:hypothetical protein
VSALSDNFETLSIQDQQVDGVEGGVSETRRWIDGDQATILSSVEDVHRGHITM